MPRHLIALVLCLAAAAFAGADEGFVTITADSTPLRVDASATADTVGVATRGQRLGVLSTLGEWIRVAQPGTGYGVWIHRSATGPQPAAPATTLPTPSRPVAVTPAPAPVAAPTPPPVVVPVAPAPRPVPPVAQGPVSPPPAYEPPEVEESRESRGKFETTGVGVGVGYGYQHAGVGGAVYAYIQGRSPIKFALYGGGGYFPSTTGDADFSVDNSYGYALGGMLLIGGKHRGVLDVSYGLAVHEAGYAMTTTSRYTKYSAYDNVLYGLTGAVGYEFMAGNGFFVRPTIGMTRLNEPTQMDGEQNIWTLNLTLGFKFF
jgi:hypothetical protein